MCQSWDGKRTLQQYAELIDTYSVVPTTGGGSRRSSKEAPGNPGIRKWNQDRNCSLTGARSWPGANVAENGAPSEVWVMPKVQWWPSPYPMFLPFMTGIKMCPSFQAPLKAHLPLENPPLSHIETYCSSKGWQYSLSVPFILMALPEGIWGCLYFPVRLVFF